jgi:lipopolysaccharide/colanic/teichoic acid biosynthesis glycosyltransferase
MVRRLAEVIISSTALILIAPLLAVAAIGIRLSSHGPIIYRARRVGIHGRVFSMYKLRTMHIDHGSFGGLITVNHDPRIFKFGSWLRRLKIDELPQFINIIKGEMSIVGPRPEDPEIMRAHYSLDQYETLNRLPGLASPGSLYNYTYGEQRVQGDGANEYYAGHLLPVKLAVDIVYVREASFVYDIRIIMRTIWSIFCKAVGRTRFPDPPEIKKAFAMGLLPGSARPENSIHSLASAAPARPPDNGTFLKDA